MIRFLFAGLYVLLPLCSSVFAQSVCPDIPPPYGLLRQDEDYGISAIRLAGKSMGSSQVCAAWIE